MSQIYCTSCGFGNHTAFAIPKFCGGCGESLTVSVTGSTKATEKVEESEIPDIKKLDVLITVKKPQFEKFEQVLGSGATGLNRPLNRGKIDRKKFLAEYQKEIAKTKVISIGDREQ